MDDLRLEELSADTALAANSLELRPGQEDFLTPVTYENADATIDHTNTWSRVVLLGDEVVGFIRAHFDAGNPQEELRCCIWRVNVAASAQGKGVGRFAVDAVCSEAQDRGFSSLTVAWQDGDEGPGHFFHRLGFVNTGVSEYGDVIGSLALD
jgi:diamine N-acetyltransferase